MGCVTRNPDRAESLKTCGIPAFHRLVAKGTGDWRSRGEETSGQGEDRFDNGGETGTQEAENINMIYEVVSSCVSDNPVL